MRVFIARSQSPPYRVNFSNLAHVPKELREAYIYCLNPLLIGSTFLTVKKWRMAKSPIWLSQSPPYRVNFSNSCWKFCWNTGKIGGPFREPPSFFSPLGLFTINNLPKRPKNQAYFFSGTNPKIGHLQGQLRFPHIPSQPYSIFKEPIHQ